MMKYCFSTIGTTLVLLSLIAYGPKKEKYYPVNDDSLRVSSLGFSISPPPGRDWYEKHLSNTLYYFKRTRENGYALTTQATELTFANESNHKGELLEYVQKHKQNACSASRYHNSTFDYSYEKIASGLCIRYQFKYDDYGSTKKGHYPYIEVFSEGLVCRHPLAPEIGIDLNYMEQTLPALRTPSFRNEGEKFISSLNFYNTENY